MLFRGAGAKGLRHQAAGFPRCLVRMPAVFVPTEALALGRDTHDAIKQVEREKSL